jgi:hypothetical protein
VNKGSLLSGFLTAIIISGLILASTVHFGRVQASTNVSGIISSDTTWTKANSPYTLVGPVIVKSGVTLTIEAGATVNLGSNYILVDGTLVAKGSSTDKIHFSSDEYAISYPYYGIYFSESSIDWNEQTLTGSLIENADFNLTTIVADYAAPKINFNAFSGNLTLADGLLQEYFIRGFTSISVIGDWPVISNNTLINTGIAIGEGATPTVVNNTIINTVPAIVNDTATHRVLPTYYVGVSCSSSALISNNVITGWTLCGIDTKGGYNKGEVPNIPIIENNLIHNNNIGIQSTDSVTRVEFYPAYNYPTIQNNTITQNSVGLRILSYSGLSEWSERLFMFKLANNNIQDNFDYNLYASKIRSDINATYNWWGATDPDAINNTIYDDKNDTGQVNFIPFLTAPNPAVQLIPSSTPTPTPTPTHQQAESFPTTLVIGSVITVAVIGIGLLVYFKKRGHAKINKHSEIKQSSK